jgi:hypothetical protein
MLRLSAALNDETILYYECKVTDSSQICVFISQFLDNLECQPCSREHGMIIRKCYLPIKRRNCIYFIRDNLDFNMEYDGLDCDVITKHNKYGYYTVKVEYPELF